MDLKTFRKHSGPAGNETEDRRVQKAEKYPEGWGEGGWGEDQQTKDS